MIDKKKLIETIHNMIETDWGKGQTHSLAEGYANVLEVVENQPTVGEWIPCSKALPEEVEDGKPNGWVYGFTDYGVIVPTFLKCGMWHDEEGYPLSDVKIVAWIPLPEPYKDK